MYEIQEKERCIIFRIMSALFTSFDSNKIYGTLQYNMSIFVLTDNVFISAVNE